ncbi:hypothetical protein EJB05_52194, partial [Eragrostis curvula]
MMENETRAATARVLVLLSQQRQRGGVGSVQRGGRLFQCKTCGRRFPTFQALGGHRASHRRPEPYYGLGRRKLEAAHAHDGECAAGPIRVHGCPVCGVEFAVGQALGGHMRRHRAAAAANAGARGSRAVTPEACISEPTAAKADDDGGDCVDGICLELNLTPSASCAKCQKKAAGLGTEHKFVFDCIL